MGDMAKGKTASTAAVVVTFNRRELLEQSIRSLLNQEGATCDVLVVDNASTDGTKEMIEETFAGERVKYHNTGSNLGGAGGYHVGIEWAVKEGYDYVWVTDDDSQPEPNALYELHAAGEKLGGGWGFLNSAVYWVDGSICMANRPKKSLFRHMGAKEFAGHETPAVMGSFVSMLIPASVVREVGLPLSEYFIWTDDYEYSGRISKRHPGYFVPSSKVTHAMAANTRADLVTASGDRLERFRSLYRNDVHCYKQQGAMGILYLIAKGGYTTADVLLHAKDRRVDRLKSLVAGYKAGLSFNPEVKYVDE